MILEALKVVQAILVYLLKKQTGLLASYPNAGADNHVGPVKVAVRKIARPNPFHTPVSTGLDSGAVEHFNHIRAVINHRQPSQFWPARLFLEYQTFPD